MYCSLSTLLLVIYQGDRILPLTHIILHYYGNIVNTKSPFFKKIFFQKQQNTPQAKRSVLPKSNKRTKVEKIWQTNSYKPSLPQLQRVVKESCSNLVLLAGELFCGIADWGNFVILVGELFCNIGNMGFFLKLVIWVIWGSF